MVDILQITFLSPILHVIFLQFFTVDVSIKLPSNFFLNFVILQLPQLFSVREGSSWHTALETQLVISEPIFQTLKRNNFEPFVDKKNIYIFWKSQHVPTSQVATLQLCTTQEF